MALLLMQPETHLTEQILTREEPETFTLMSFSFECTTYIPQTLPVSVKTHLGTVLRSCQTDPQPICKPIDVLVYS